jgi:hypothetical protein
VLSKSETQSTVWGSGAAADEAQLNSERDAFGKLMDAIVAS